MQSRGVRLLEYSKARVLGDGFGALADGVLCELTWEQKLDGGLDLSGGKSMLVVVAGQFGAFG